MKLGIMQPYFFPYIGYWQLINYVDTFIIYDNIQYTKRGWFNRNRYLLNGKDALFSINLKSGSDKLNVDAREISPVYNREKLMLKFQNAYHGAPYIDIILPMICEIIRFPDNNLFGYLFNSITRICDYLGIKTKILISSQVDINHSAQAEDKVVAFCKKMHASTYVNLIGGVKLYSNTRFAKENLELKFLEADFVKYRQFDNEFVPFLSVIDVMMFNSREETMTMLNQFSLV